MDAYKSLNWMLISLKSSQWKESFMYKQQYNSALTLHF